MSAIKEAQDFWVCNQFQSVKVPFNENEKESLDDPVTILELFKDTVASNGDRTALMSKNRTTNEWEGINYRELLLIVETTAKAFIKLGLKRNGVVAIFSPNRKEWLISDLAAIFAGGIAMGIYVSNAANTCLQALKSSSASIVIVDDEEQMHKINEIINELPDLKAIVQISQPTNNSSSDERYWQWSQLELLDTSDVEEEYRKRSIDIGANECCALIHTSGTTGASKAVMVSHDNFTWTAKKMSTRLGVSSGTQEVFMSYLPLAHMAGQIMDIYLTIQVAATIFFAEKDALKTSFMQTLVEVRPTLFIGVPRIFEKLQSRMIELENQSNGLRRSLETAAKHLSLKHHLSSLSNPFLPSILHELFKKLIHDKKKKALGLDRCRNLLGAAAPMLTSTRTFFMSLDLPILLKYGMTEVVVICIASKDVRSLDTVGRCINGLQARVSCPNENGKGEICIRGRSVFMGYLNDPDKSRDAIDDEGWLHTGDQGFIDDDGFIFITGRLKEIIVTSGGVNVSPFFTENLVKAECHAISNAFLVGDQRKFLTMLVSLKTMMTHEGMPTDDLAPETLKWLETIDVPAQKLTEILDGGPNRKVVEAIQEAIDRANKKAISNPQRIQRFAILPHDFSFPTGELGPTLKLKRNFVLEKYKKLIDSLYI